MPLFFVFLRDASGRPAANPVGVYLDNQDEATKHAGRIGGMVVRVEATEVK